MNIDSEWFKARGKKLKKSQALLGEALNVDRTTAGRLINSGAGLYAWRIPDLAKFYEVPIEEVLCRLGLLKPLKLPDAEVLSNLLEAAQLFSQRSPAQPNDALIYAHGVLLGLRRIVENPEIVDDLQRYQDALNYVRDSVNESMKQPSRSSSSTKARKADTRENSQP